VITNILIFSDIGRLYNLLVDNDAVRWSVPSALSGCIQGYELFFHGATSPEYMDSQNNYLPLNRLPSNVCDGDLTISPVIPTQYQPLQTSQIQTNICENGKYREFTGWAWLQFIWSGLLIA